jgi:hypothetical protein
VWCFVDEVCCAIEKRTERERARVKKKAEEEGKSIESSVIDFLILFFFLTKISSLTRIKIIKTFNKDLTEKEKKKFNKDKKTQFITNFKILYD